ncbi:MAG TPA: hypothetical protein VGL99_23480 [Chloroflexota bacterium]|jgi:hypothetical protein
MSSRLERLAIEVVVMFVALSALGGGVGLLGGGLAFPPEWLAGTPFTSYTVPGVILGLAVGGSALAAFVLMLLRHPWGIPVAAAAGAIEVGWIVGELILVGTRGNVMLALQVLYFGAGAIVAVLAVHLLLGSDPRSVSFEMPQQ